MAALVFRDGSICVIYLPGDHRVKDEGVRNLTQEGYHVFYWTQAGVGFWAVSELNEQGLQEFVHLYQ